MNYKISTIKNYPDDGNHQVCEIGLPFCIRKGQDSYTYNDKNGKEKHYNNFKSANKVDSRWICHLKENASESLSEIFEIKCNKKLEVIINYCVKTYIKSLKMEVKRIKLELENMEG